MSDRTSTTPLRIRRIASRASAAWLIASLTLVAGSVATRADAQVRSVYPDDSVAARDAIVRVVELHAAGNTGEAVRVLQGVLDVDAERLLPSPDEPDVLRPVREAVHELLRADAALRERYVAEQEPVAAKLLASGETARVERTMLMTPSGFEAAMRLAQLEIEQARFHSARMMLAQLGSHPGRVGDPGKAAARLAMLLSGYLPECSETAAAWSAEASVDAGKSAAARSTPLKALRRSRDPLEAGPAPKGDGGGMNPLQSAAFEPDAQADRASLDEELDGGRFGGGRSSWIFPAVDAGRVLASDGVSLCAWDAATLMPLWRCVPSGRSLTETFRSEETLQMGLAGGRGGVEDPATVACAQGVAVFAGGLAFNGARAGDNAIHAVDAATGASLWSVDLAQVESKRLGGREANSAVAVRGNLVIDGDIVVAAMRRTGQLRRITSLYLVGFDLHTGEVKWTRLVGGYGTNPWGRTTTRPEGMTVGRGVVYRCDDMGVLAAVEAATGRPRWVRLLPTRASFDFTMRTDDEPPPQAMHVPVLRDGSLFAIEPELVNSPGRVIEVSSETGRLLHERQGSALASPEYLIDAGDHLAAVGQTRIAVVARRELATGTVKLSEAYSQANIVGRAVASSDGRILLPLVDAVVSIDPKDPASSVRRPVSVSGNLVVAPAEADAGEHLLIADDRGLHTYLEWSSAQALLERRMKAAPDQVDPVLTYVDLASRVGRAEMVAALSDRALAIVDASRDRDAGARTRLYRLLAEAVLQSRRAHGSVAASASGDQPSTTGSQFQRPPVRDLAVLDEICDRLSRAAETPVQIASASFERAWLRTVQKRYTDAVEACQQVLLTPALAEATLVVEGVSRESVEAGVSDATRTGADLAKEKLVDLLRGQGLASYAAFDEECAREAALIADSTDPERFETLARRYPLSARAALLWGRAGELRAASGDRSGARRALGEGVAAAELASSLGRREIEPVIGELAGRLVVVASGLGDAEPMHALLERLAKDHPSSSFASSVSFPGTPPCSTPRQLADALDEMLAGRTALPRVGVEGLVASQALAGWEPLAPVSRHAAGSSGAGLVMFNERLGQVAYWAVDALDGRLRVVWTRRFEARPTVVRATPRATWLFWPTASGGVLESVLNAGGSREAGSTQWKSQDVGTLFPAMTPGESVDRFNTPTDGQVRPDDMLVLCDASRLVVVQRRGGVACFDGATGGLAWTRALEISRVFEAELTSGHLVVAGTFLPRGDSRYQPLVVASAIGDGAESARLGADRLGDHPRWLRDAGGGDVLVGAASGLVRFSPANGEVRWTIPGEPARSSIGAWIVGGSAIFLTNDSQLWRVDLARAELDHAPVDSHGRVGFPLSARVNGRTLVVSSSKGLAVLSEEGRLAGLDGLDGVPVVQPPEPGDRVVFAVEADPMAADGGWSSVRLFGFEHPTGRLLGVRSLRVGESPSSLWLIDGKIIMPCGSITLVIDAPAER